MTTSAVSEGLLQDLLEHTRLELMETADMSGKAVDGLMTCVPHSDAAVVHSPRASLRTRHTVVTSMQRSGTPMRACLETPSS